VAAVELLDRMARAPRVAQADRVAVVVAAAAETAVVAPGLPVRLMAAMAAITVGRQVAELEALLQRRLQQEQTVEAEAAETIRALILMVRTVEQEQSGQRMAPVLVVEPDQMEM
jgi:hypothetical protein